MTPAPAAAPPVTKSPNQGNAARWSEAPVGVGGAMKTSSTPTTPPPAGAKTHYTGAITYRTADGFRVSILAGGAACGATAAQLGSAESSEVTCKKCRHRLQLAGAMATQETP